MSSCESTCREPFCSEDEQEGGLDADCVPCRKICIIKPEAQTLSFLMPTEIKLVSCIADADRDVIVVVGPHEPPELEQIFSQYRAVDCAFDSVVSSFYDPTTCLQVIYSPLVPVTDYHDVRVYHDAAILALKRAISGKFKNPLLIVPKCSRFVKADLITVLGALQALYVPLQVREEYPGAQCKLIEMLWLLVDECKAATLCEDVTKLEPGRYIYRDIAMADPERMTPILTEDYMYELFKDGSILLEILCEPLFLKKQFPLYDAVNRAGLKAVKRHQGRIVLLEYIPKCLPEKTLLLIGKGTTMDTGGVTLKIDCMAGASREKSGAAAVIGIMKIVALLKPPCIHVISAVPLVRNSIGEEAYVPDEIVKDRAGIRVRFNNTDREGRLIMSDPLTFLKEQVIARRLPDPHLFTVGTMTKHARYVAGDGYPIIMDNSVARVCCHARKIQTVGTLYGEPFEISVLRKDDFDSNKGKVIGEDLVQSDCCNQNITMRAHQIPGAFLIQSSLMNEHDEGSCLPIKYSHIDMEGNAYNYPFIPASQPVITIIKAHVA